MKKRLLLSYCGSCVIAGTVLFLVLMAALHLLRPDFNPLRRFMSEYLVGSFGFLGTAAVYILIGTFLALLIGLRLSILPSGFLTASCVQLSVMVVALWACAVFPLDPLPQDGSRPAFTRAAVIHIVSSAVLFASLMALLLTLPSACKRDESWRPFSRVTLFLGFLTLVSFAGLIIAPYYLRGLAQRTMALPVLIWLLLTGLRLRRAMPESFRGGGNAAR